MKKYLFIILSSLLLVSCTKQYNEDFAVGQNEQLNKSIEQEKQIEKSLTQANKIISLKEKENISSYIERRKWNMQEKNGIYYQITKQGVGENITDSNIVSLRYDCYLLNGQRYGQTKTQQQTFNAKADTQVPFGLLMAVKNLRNKSQARIIIPSNLAFSTSEDGEKLKQNNTLVYIVEVTNVEKQ